ncbi:MAG: hypothetical protein V3U91_03285 [Candidatus Aminicenantaceae bacterium]|jgi:hypothetical protein
MWIIFVIPAEAGIQTYLDKSLSYFWFPASAGMTFCGSIGIFYE